ncbi:MAG TPA: hypothetical protein VF802_09450 [Candidatus Limnocylindrales bacterium]
MDIDFTGYGVDFIVAGRVELGRGRLTDALAAWDEIVIHDAVLEGLHDLARVTVPEYVVPRDELLAAAGSGPRGELALRVPTTGRRMQACVGPYQVLGRVHTHRDGSIAARVLEAGPLVPLTDATIAYVIGGVLEVRDAPLVHVNRELATWLRPAAAPAGGRAATLGRIAGAL